MSPGAEAVTGDLKNWGVLKIQSFLSASDENFTVHTTPSADNTRVSLTKFTHESTKFQNNLDRSEMVFAVTFSAHELWTIEQHALLTFPTYYANHIGDSLQC